jgi:hypothetical protein
MQCNEVSVSYQGSEVAERDWLICGLLWVAMGTLALGPFGFIARAGRVLFAFTLLVHGVEAVYVAFRAWMAGFSVSTWFFRTIVLSLFALLALQRELGKVPRGRLVR